MVGVREHVQLRRHARMAELESILFTGRRERFSPAETAAYFRDYRQQCALEMGAERDAIAARNEMQTRRTAYLEANRQVKVVARLEDKARARHRAENARAEQTELDEFASHRALRRGNSLFAS